MNESSPLVSSGTPTSPIPKVEDDHEPKVKEINHIGSFTLLINNMVGPAMLGIPRLYQQAGLIPTTICIVFIYLCATLSGTLFSDAISSIPGNKLFDRHVDFSSAFKLVIGIEFYIIAETLFLITCVVQAVAAIVEAAQSVDGFLASFLIGRTYALEIYPNPGLISWTPELCLRDESMVNDGDVPSTEGLDCTPFNGSGSLIITLGFVLTTMLFLPLGRGYLKETIIVQLLAFTFMCLLLVQFSYEFALKGFPHEIEYFGDSMSQLAGVVLFNYAYIVTVPSWLCEKQNSVPVNSTIWQASTLSTAIYIVFGIMCAKTFGSLGGNALIMLTSSKVQLLTRVCAALFGVVIIGSGVPVFCVMIRTAIYHSKTLDYEWSLFLGSVGPFLLSWPLYQGTLLLSVVNWTGLVVNGFVAFLLPMYLVLRSLALRHLDHMPSHDPEDSVLLSMVRTGHNHSHDHDHSSSGSGTCASPLSRDMEVSVDYGTVANSGTARPVRPNTHYHLPEHCDSHTAGVYAHEGHSSEVCEDSSVEPLPPFLEPYRYPIVLFMIVCFATIIGGTIFLDIYFGIQPAE